ncbi:hypothetical protein OIU85_003095 [Salix viminalis]|uniref:Leucine-rich repeat-containing N-terminal plant-type domain-containing protein n=1 Tax=Salix viminalis TaxID=40686 RepID=A0A9Q0T192_SALVM|nr:hypothetical protein OIU85_003095 [Salix viminalis]
MLTSNHVSASITDHQQAAGGVLEVEALLKWKKSLSGQAQSLLSSWKQVPGSDKSPCTWSGIHCINGGSVSTINLTSFQLKGTLDDFNFSSFHNLSCLDLQHNSLIGNIPPRISNLSKLEILNLGYNHAKPRQQSPVRLNPAGARKVEIPQRASLEFK